MRPFGRLSRAKAEAQRSPETRLFQPRGFAPSLRPAAPSRVPVLHSVQGRRVQAKHGVQIGLEQLDIEDAHGGELETTHKELRIATVHIADRPPGLFTPDEKSHTTAWAVYTDQVRNAILGRSVTDAMQAVRNLYTDAQNLPGVTRADLLIGPAKTSYDTAKKKMDGLVAIDPGGIPEERHVDLLQRLAKGFLSYRNAIPLSQIDIGRATGHGEPEVLKLLRPVNDLVRGWEPNPEEEGSLRLQAGLGASVRAAMWSLLDGPAVQSLDVLTPDPTKAPGTHEDDSGPPMRVAEAIVQHLWTLESTYETAFREAAMDSQESIQGYLASIGYTGRYGGLIYRNIAALYEGGLDKAAQENPERYRTGGPAGQGDFSVQVFTGPEVRVSELFIGGRAPTLLGSSQGSHSTAWITYVDAVRNQVLGKTLDEAVAGVIELFKDLDALPGMKRLENLEEHQAYWFALANNERKAALTALESITSPLQRIPALQRLIKAYLGFRNAVPLSQVKGGLADGNAEAHNRAKLRYLESDYTLWTGLGAAPPRDPGIYLEAFWELYDYKAMGKAARHELEPPDAPGITRREDPVGIVAAGLQQHLLTMRRSYPKTFEAVGADGPESIDYVLHKMNFPSNYKEVSALFQ